MIKVRWSIYWERKNLPPLREVYDSNEAAARLEFEKFKQYPGFLAREEIVEIHGDPDDK